MHKHNQAANEISQPLANIKHSCMHNHSTVTKADFAQVKVMKRVRDIREQLLGLMDRTEIELTSNLGDHDAIKKAIAAGFFYNTSRLRKDGSYRTVKNPQTIHLHPSSGLTKMEVLFPSSSCIDCLPHFFAFDNADCRPLTHSRD